VPAGAPVVFSAHGVPKSVPAEAEERELAYLDATCPLVSKVHRQAERQVEAGRHIVFIGHRGHPEAIGTYGQVPEGHMTVVETSPKSPSSISLPARRWPSSPRQPCRSTTPPRIVEALKARYPAIVGPKAEDICYATSNRQTAVKQIAPQSDLVLVIGAPNSSNSVRLVEVAERCGTPARLIQRASEIDPAWLEGVEHGRRYGGRLGAREARARVIERLGEWRAVDEHTLVTAEEKMIFKLPRQLID
jgi:4-hydroxy-3-methylbut-2-enyl diphosphate reductase